MSVAFGLTVMTAVIIFLVVCEDMVASLFTEDEEDIYYIKSVLHIIGLYLIADTVHGVQSGNVRGLGKQGLASVVTIACYYIFGMPLALYLGFEKGHELAGFWGGFLVAIIILDILVIIVVMRADWVKPFKEDEKKEVEGKKVDDDFLAVKSQGSPASTRDTDPNLQAAVN